MFVTKITRVGKQKFQGSRFTVKKAIFLFLSLTIVLSFSGCNKVDSTLKEEPQADYTAFLNDLYESNDKKEALEFLIKDIDNNGTPELVVAKNGANITVYTYDGKVIEVGDRNYETGTTRFLFSENTSYLGIICFYAGGGLEHYRYITINDMKLVDDELWNEDYSGISKEIGESRERIEEFSDDKQLVEESRKVYQENNDLSFEKLKPSNF